MASPTSRCLAHAKINLGLLVTARRSDGYHEICTVFHRIRASDEIALSTWDTIEVHTTDEAAPPGEANICHEAALLVRGELGTDRGVRIDIRKNIPVGAGLGGGSADAAAVLRALPSFWGGRLTAERARTLALRLGSDVPYFLSPGSAVGRGRGEILEHFTLDIPFALLVCTPPLHLSTAWAYARVVPRTTPCGDLRRALLEALADPSLLAERLHNDLEGPVLREHPELGALREALIRQGAIAAAMSGSGSSFYGLFGDEGAARKAAGAIAQMSCRTFITPPHFQGEW